MATTKRYTATAEPMSGASYEVRLDSSGTIIVDNITGITSGTLYAKRGIVSVTINGESHSLAVSGDITNIEAAANAIKSILYVLNVPVDDSPSTEAITDAVNVAGDKAGSLTFAELEPVF